MDRSQLTSVSSQPLASAIDASSPKLNSDTNLLASVSNVSFTGEAIDRSCAAHATVEQPSSSHVAEEPMQPTGMPPTPVQFSNKASPSALDVNKSLPSAQTETSSLHEPELPSNYAFPCMTESLPLATTGLNGHSTSIVKKSVPSSEPESSTDHVSSFMTKSLPCATASASAVNESVSSVQTETTPFVKRELPTNHASPCITKSLPSAIVDFNLSVSSESLGIPAAMISNNASPTVATESTFFTGLEAAAELELPNVRDPVSSLAVAESSVGVHGAIQLEGRQHRHTVRLPSQQDREHREQPLSLIDTRLSTLDSTELEALSVKESINSESRRPLFPARTESHTENSSHPLPHALTSLDSQLLVRSKCFPPAVASNVPAVVIETLPSNSQDIAVTAYSMHPAVNVTSVDGESVLVVEGFGNQSGRMEDANIKKEESILCGPKEASIGSKVKKRFGKKYYDGEVIGFDPESKWYKVKYEDEDEEELEWKEVESILVPLKSDVENVKSIPDAFGGKRPCLSDDHEDKRHRKRVKKRKVSSARVDDQEASFSDKFDSQEVNISGAQVIVGLAAEGGSMILDNSDPHLPESAEIPEVVKTKGASSRSRRERERRNRKRKKPPSSAKVKLNELHSQESQNRSEHRVMTRSSTGSIGAHGSTFSGLTSSPQCKEDDLEEKKKLENAVSRTSPLGGGLKIVGRKTRKDFGGQCFTGEVVGYDSRAKYYKVRYEDGDEEELEWSELTVTLLGQEERLLSTDCPAQAAASVKKFPSRRLKDFSRRIRSPKERQTAHALYDERVTNGEISRRRKRVKTASVSVMMKGNEIEATAPDTPQMISPRTPPRALAAARFACASDADSLEYFGWGEVVNHEKTKCPELRAVRLLPTSSPVVHLAASHHHLAAITAAGQVWVWRNKHGNIHTRCNEWEHISTLEDKGIILIDIAGPDVDRTSAGYEPEQEDQVPDPFYLVAVASEGEDIVFQGSQPHERVRTYQLGDEPRYPALKDAFLLSYPDCPDDMGRIVQVSVGTVEASDESSFVGYITDTDNVYIRSATRDFVEEVNLVAGYTGKPIKIECGSVYHAILMTDDGRAWTWGRGYYPGSTSTSSGFSNKWSFSVCQPAVGTLVGRKVVDVGCYGEDFIALTNDGDVHQWTHGVPNPVAGVYNVPATPIYGQGPCIPSVDKLKQVSIGAGMCAGITESGRVHTWRTTMKGVAGVVASEREILTPLGRDEGQKDTAILSLGVRVATKVMCMAGSLIVIVKRKSKSRRGGKKKSVLSSAHKMNRE